jgi:hypothetical protein
VIFLRFIGGWDDLIWADFDDDEVVWWKIRRRKKNGDKEREDFDGIIRTVIGNCLE